MGCAISPEAGTGDPLMLGASGPRMMAEQNSSDATKKMADQFGANRRSIITERKLSH